MPPARRESRLEVGGLSHTARVFAEHPLLLELKRLETLEEVAQKVGAVELRVGGDALATVLGDALGKPRAT